MAIPVKALPPRYGKPHLTLSGGQGTVYVCRDQMLERDVAIKFIQPGGDQSTILKEILALQSIRSKHIVEIYDVIKLAGSPYFGLCQEFIPGDDLLEQMNAAKQLLSSDQLVSMVYQMACGVRDIHAANLIHRDLKPNNMKLNQENILKIYDFGLVKSVSPASTVGFKGTPGFAAPELFNSHPEFDSRVDVFSLGATAWFLATGDLPSEFKAIPPSKLTKSLKSVRADLPDSVVKIIDKALDFDPKQRPTAAEFAKVFGQRLSFGKHVGILANDYERFVLDKPGASIDIVHPLVTAKISYNGEGFVLNVAAGSVSINSKPVQGQIDLTGACVLIFEGPNHRVSYPFFVSSPEIVL